MILLFNKSDLPQKIDKRRCRAANSQSLRLAISALKGKNLDRLREMIHDTYVPKETAEEEVILHLRQKLLLEQMLDSLTMALRLLKQGHSEEVCAEEIAQALPFIGELTGEIETNDVIEDIFSRFCVGK
jgi:tRNA modification GTPase